MYAMFTVVALEAGLNFSVPLYIQIIQGRTPIETAIAMLPFNLSVFFSAMLIVRCYQLLTPRQIGRLGFITCTIALLWLAFVVHNDWSAVAVLVGLVVFGIGQGSLVTLVFNVLVTASPKELAGDVGSLRGTANNLAAAVGTAVVGALLVGLLSAAVLRSIADSPLLPLEIQSEVDLDNINFVSNDRLLGIMQRTSATPEQVVEAGTHQYRRTAQCAQNGFVDHGGTRTVGDHSRRPVARLQARRNPRQSAASATWRHENGAHCMTAGGHNVRAC